MPLTKLRARHRLQTGGLDALPVTSTKAQAPVKPVKNPASIVQILVVRILFWYLVSYVNKIIYYYSIQTRALASQRASGGNVRWLLYFLHAQAACGPSNPAR